MAMSVVYANIGGRISCEVRAGAVSHFAPDCQGSTIAQMNQSGVVTDTYDYWSYGEERIHSGASITDLTFLGVLGYFKDILNKVYYVRARFYRPDLARWQTVDPLWPEERAYEYSGDAPTAFSDPSGKSFRSFVKGFLGLCIVAFTPVTCGSLAPLCDIYCWGKGGLFGCAPLTKPPFLECLCYRPAK